MYLSVWEGNINNSTFGKDFTAVDTATSNAPNYP